MLYESMKHHLLLRAHVDAKLITVEVASSLHLFPNPDLTHYYHMQQGKEQASKCGPTSGIVFALSQLRTLPIEAIWSGESLSGVEYSWLSG